MPAKLLLLPEAITAIDNFKAQNHPQVQRCDYKTPTLVFQYWDKEPPKQISTLLNRNRMLCEQNGIKHIIIDDIMARDFIKAYFAEDVYKAYDISPHPAMKCDLFRLCYLYQQGGFYLDADMGFTDNFGELFALRGELIIFKWDSQNRITVLNGAIGAIAGSSVIEYVLNAATASILSACKVNPETAIKGILGISGPVLFTRAIGSFIAAQNTISAEQQLTIHVERVDTMFRWIRNGPDFLKQPLEYKNTDLHWLVAAKK